ncbi:acid phosphatase [Ranunculus cassubicifolius]
MCLASTAYGDFHRLEHPIKADGSLNFLVVGDWGRRGAYNQSQVAFQMGKIGEELDIEFVVSTGDNFYDNGLTDINDQAFNESFSKIYTAKGLQKTWYTVLGNHDYRGNVEAQLSKVLKNLDHRWVCLRSYVLNAEMVEIFFVDTTPFVDKYFTNPEDHTYDWSGVNPRQDYLAKILKNLESGLRKSTAQWKIVVGHHTIRSIGQHGDTIELVNQILPILERNSVDFYVNGHDHCLEHMCGTTSAVQFLTSGGGSKAWRGDIGLDRDGVKFYYDGQGFMSVQINKDSAKIVFYDAFGKVLHTWKKFKEHSTM